MKHDVMPARIPSSANQPQSHRLRAILRRLSEPPKAPRLGEVAGLVADAILERDEDALAASQGALQRTYAQHLSNDALCEERGRILSLIDTVDWTLRRITPLGVLGRLRRGTTERRFLEVLADESKQLDTDLADVL